MRHSSTSTSFKCKILLYITSSVLFFAVLNSIYLWEVSNDDEASTHEFSHPFGKIIHQDVGQSTVRLGVAPLGTPVSENTHTKKDMSIIDKSVNAIEAPQDSNRNKTDKSIYLYDPEVSRISFKDALTLYYSNLELKLKDDPNQHTKSFKDVNELPDHGVLLPHNPEYVPDPKTYTACDARDADFTIARDRLCQEYLSNLNNMQSIKALSSLLYSGRTLKFKIYYRHNNINAKVKLSQKTFVREASSEYLAYAIDRALNFTSVPTTAFTELPLDYMRAASGVLSPFYSQWFTSSIPLYSKTESHFVTCSEMTAYAEYLSSTIQPGNAKSAKDKLTKGCSLVSIQLWMNDVNRGLNTYLAIPHEYNIRFANSFLRPFGNSTNADNVWPPRRPHWKLALGDICDRFIFDFIIGNTDRGMNNFVYGGCDNTTECKPKSLQNSIKGEAKYAYIDHGISFHSLKEPWDNPFTNHMRICRFRRKTYKSLKYFDREVWEDDWSKLYKRQVSKSLSSNIKPVISRPLVTYVRDNLVPKGVFKVVRVSVFNNIQDKLQKLIKIIDACIDEFGEDEVFSL